LRLNDVQRYLKPSVKAKLAEDVLHVHFHGGLTDEKCTRDFSI